MKKYYIVWHKNNDKIQKKLKSIIIQKMVGSKSKISCKTSKIAEKLGKGFTVEQYDIVYLATQQQSKLIIIHPQGNAWQNRVWYGMIPAVVV